MSDCMYMRIYVYNACHVCNNCCKKRLIDLKFDRYIHMLFKLTAQICYNLVYLLIYMDIQQNSDMLWSLGEDCLKYSLMMLNYFKHIKRYILVCGVWYLNKNIIRATFNVLFHSHSKYSTTLSFMSDNSKIFILSSVMLFQV